MTLSKRIKPKSVISNQAVFSPLVGKHKTWDEYWALVSPRLKERKQGFKVIFDYLRSESIYNPHVTIVETGSLREPHNYEGDGNSSFLFDTFIEYHTGEFHTNDIDSKVCQQARMMLAHAQVHESDSVKWLSTLDKMVDVLYLDSFNIDNWNHDWPAAAHHLKELLAAIHCLEPGALLVVDDNVVHPNTKQKIGKGRLVREYVEATDSARLIHDGYQEIWQWGKA